MDPYSIPFESFAKLRPWTFTRVADVAALSRVTALDLIGALRRAVADGRQLMVICPVGPIDYTHWADALNREQLDGSQLVTVNMDEYTDAAGRLIGVDHPLSFRRFMNENLFDRLQGRAAIPESNRIFPSPDDPEATTRLIERHGGADLCFGGMGLTGHFAFNDPPEPGAPDAGGEVRNSRTRVLTISRESQAQMCMGGTGGNWDILPRRAVTLGMYELLLSKRIHLTFMRSWHAGVLRRALFGPVSGQCPGSFVQEHPDVTVTLTDLAAALPLLHIAQRVGA
jgi:glucosamine-6-phosphate deaminase